MSQRFIHCGKWWFWTCILYKFKTITFQLSMVDTKGSWVSTFTKREHFFLFKTNSITSFQKTNSLEVTSEIDWGLRRSLEARSLPQVRKPDFHVSLPGFILTFRFHCIGMWALPFEREWRTYEKSKNHFTFLKVWMFILNIHLLGFFLTSWFHLHNQWKLTFVWYIYQNQRLDKEEWAFENSESLYLIYAWLASFKLSAQTLSSSAKVPWKYFAGRLF